MFLVNSRYPRFTATSTSLGRKVRHQRRHTFSRSYGVNLPSSLTRLLPSALVFSTCPPESVWGTVTSSSNAVRSFSWKHGINHLWLKAATSPLGVMLLRFIPGRTAYRFVPPIPHGGRFSLLRPRSAHDWWYRNIHLFSIDFAFRLRLRCRLTLPGLSWDRNPWASGERVFHPLYRYSCQHSHFQKLHQSLRNGFTVTRTLLYHL